MGYVYNSLDRMVESDDIPFDYSTLDLTFENGYGSNHLVSSCGEYHILVSWSCRINDELEFMFANNDSNDTEDIVTLEGPTYIEFLTTLSYKGKYPPAIKMLRDLKIDALLK